MIDMDALSTLEAEDFGRRLPRGLGVNLLCRDVGAEIRFCRDVLGARLIRGDRDFATFEILGSLFLLHSDWTYRTHEFRGVFEGETIRGRGIELRLYGLDPDRAEQRAIASGATVLAGSIDKPHGLRECHLVDGEGYVWVPSVAT
nr:hypothetical protein [uncultured Gellertiella sp.]